MEDVDKKMVVSHIVEHIFLSDVMVILNGFIVKLNEWITYERGYYETTGYHLTTPPILFDLRHAQMHLTGSICAALKEPKQDVG